MLQLGSLSFFRMAKSRWEIENQGFNDGKNLWLSAGPQPRSRPLPEFSRIRQANCRHLVWLLGFMSEGNHRVERVPKEWVDDVRQRVDSGRAFQDALREVLTANAELLVLRRKQQPH